ncbi:hypothetical protein HYH02_013223 [Chlamydomonas schloesseri]|uniref:PCI domain-containing protein n=1 Tax=Chlamydomonas schloesseri TaxID=2026947 RepID=A0A835T4X2_9CHLO|nr:hypothetical protein HYH02_013223 [Chlamydomonas schloesseri]|eukprot:KAG2431646.1 hypothetical protein HYH02_013223 [Chlamydomonas schloesseri]
MAAELESRLKSATELGATDVPGAAAQLKGLVLEESSNDAEAVRIKEQAISQLCELYIKQANSQALADLLTSLRGFFNAIPKAKTAKLVRSIIDSIAKVPGSTQLQVEVCRSQVEWAKAEKRTFLRQRIELRLASLYMQTKDYPAALALISTLLSEVKKLDDKLLLVDIYLLESKVNHALRNVPKARASLTAARTAANAIYVPLQLQAEIDCQSGILCADEKDYKTAYSYFFESFEQLASMDDPRAAQVLKYMLLAKVMLDQADDVPGIISSKAGLKYTGPEVEAMRAVAAAYHDRSLQAFQDTLAAHSAQLVDDLVVGAHLAALYDTLMQQNLVRLIEPFSRVEIAHVASLIGLPRDTVEAKLSQMILDGKLAGTLDAGAGCLEVFTPAPADGVYPAALDVLESLGRVVDTLFARSQRVVA